MTRKKVKLQYIASDSARKATFKKRKKGLMKKVDELTTLCGIEACAIIYGPYDPEPEVWPSALGVQRVLARFRRMPEMEQSKKMMNQESYIKQRILKAEDQLRKLQKENRQKEMTHVMYRCLAGDAPPNLSLLDLNDLGWLLDHNIREIQSRVEFLKKEENVGQGNAMTVVNGNGNGTSMIDEQNGVAEGMLMLQQQPPNLGAMTNLPPPTPLQDYQWFLDLLRPSGQSGGDETLFPIGQNNAFMGLHFM